MNILSLVKDREHMKMMMYILHFIVYRKCYCFLCSNAPDSTDQLIDNIEMGVYRTQGTPGPGTGTCDRLEAVCKLLTQVCHKH